MLRSTRRFGALAISLGLLLATLGLVVGGTSAGAASTPGPAPICNQQKATTPNDNCQGDKLHGEVTTSFDADGNLLFDVAAVSGFRGWSGLKICIPQVGPSDSADCTAADGPLSPSTYEVTGATGVVEGDKDVTFDCDGSFRATVAAAAVPQGDVSYTLHFSPCAGGTDEAFGTAVRPAAGGGTSSTTSSTTTSSTTSSTTTSTSTSTTTSTTTAPTTTSTPPDRTGESVTPTDGGTPTAVLGEVLVRPAEAAATPAAAVATRPAGAVAVSPATLPRTGSSSTTTLLTLGLGLVLAGILALVGAQRRAVPVRVTAGAARPTDTTSAPAAKPLALTIALLAAGAVLGRRHP